MAIIRRAEPGEANALTDLMHASSAYSGAYASIIDGYGISPQQIERDYVYVAEDVAIGISGFYSLTLETEPELDLMFVADSAQGSGIGRELFGHMRSVAAQLNLTTVKIVSHPPSVGFYQRMGAFRVGTKPPTLKARWERPILHLPI